MNQRELKKTYNYDDFKLKKLFGWVVFYKLIQRVKGGGLILHDKCIFSLYDWHTRLYEVFCDMQGL